MSNDDELVEISLGMAQDIGLVPKNMTDDLRVRLYTGNFMLESDKCAEDRRNLAEISFSNRKNDIVNQYCFDKDLYLCKFTRKEIKNAMEANL